MAGILDTAINAWKNLGAKSREDTFKYLVSKGMPPQQAMREAERIGGKIEGRQGILEMAIPQDAVDVGLMVAGGPGAKIGRRVAGGAIAAMDPSDAEAGVVGAVTEKAKTGLKKVKQAIDGTLGKDTADVRFKGKDVSEWSPKDWHDFGKQHGVDNLGPANVKEWEQGLQKFTTNSGREITIPGGETPFTYYDLLHLKSQGIDPNDLPPSVHQSIHDRMVAAMQPGPGGPSNEQITNQMIFGMISPNQPLTPNELALQRAMVKGPEDLKRWNEMIPYDYKTGQNTATPGEALKQRQGYSNQITERLGLNAAEKGGLGASGSANYSDIAEFTQKMRDRPDFFRFNPNDPSFAGMSDSQKWATHVERVLNETRGLKAKTGSLSTVWQSPQDAAISAIDRHMVTKFRGDLFDDAAKRAEWENTVLNRFNTDRGTSVQSMDELLNTQGGRGHFVEQALAYVNNLPAANTRVAKTGEFNERIPQALRDTNWVGPEPRKMELIQGPYVKALEANTAEANQAGQGLFSNQWMLWDRIRGRLEPHEIMFPGLEKLPRMSMGQMQRVRDDLSNAGYMAAEGTVRPLPSASRAGYFAFPAAVGAGSYGLLGRPEDEQY